MNSESSKLLDDIKPDIFWASTALKLRPDTTNLCIGNSYSVTHPTKIPTKVYCQVLRRKHFLLIPPFQHSCINEQTLPLASYRKAVSADAGIEI